MSVTTAADPIDEQRMRSIFKSLGAYRGQGFPGIVGVAQGKSFLDVSWGNDEPFVPDEISKVIEAIDRPWKRLIEFRWTASPESTLLVFQVPQAALWQVLFCTSRYELISEDVQEEFVSTSIGFFEATQGLFGIIGTAATRRWEVDERGLRTLRPQNVLEGLPPPEWGLLLGVEYARLLDDKKIRTAPCDVVRELDGGGFILLLVKDLRKLEQSPSELEMRRRDLVEHLGPAFFSHTASPRPKSVPLTIRNALNLKG